MWYPATVIEPPTSEPVTLAQAKQQCVVSDSSADAMLRRLIASERGFVEKYCGIKVATQTVSVKCDDFSSFARVPVAPVQSVTSISYVDTSGATQTIDQAVYEVRTDGLDTSIVLQFGKSWPSTQRGSRITVAAIAGFDPVPDDLVSAILMRVGNGYFISKKDPTLRLEDIDGVIRRDWDNTGAMAQTFRQAVSDLLENYRCWMAL
jgi:uncharacterized phiE125 gp8 family phage protein